MPTMSPASRSPTTVMTRPTNATATAAIVTARQRLAQRDLGHSTATSGVIEVRNAALAGVVVLTAYTKAIDASSRHLEASTSSGRSGTPRGDRRPAARARATNSITTMIATDRQMRYWKASASSAIRAVTAPKLHTTPDAKSASNEAPRGRGHGGRRGGER